MLKSANIILNREVSWMHFNARVLQEANDPSTPLLEKVRFLGIYANNLDEFFRIRVATISRMQGMDRRLYHDADINPKKTLKEILHIDKDQQKVFQSTFKKIVAELAENGIHIIHEKQLTAEQGRFVKNYFKEYVGWRLFPIMLNNLQPDVLSDNPVYLVVNMHSHDKLVADKIAVIPVPEKPLSRFLELPSDNEEKYIILLDDVIRYCLDDIFSVFGYNEFKAYAVKFTRDGELDIDNDVKKSFMERMSDSLRQRDVSPAVRFTYDSRMPEKLLIQILQKLAVTKRDSVIPGSRIQNFRDFMKFPNLGLADHEFKPAPPLSLSGFQKNESILKGLLEKDMLLHFPYQSFHYLLDLLREASLDPQVRAIKMTLYRVANESNIINALINAARNGKDVYVYLEVQARFDEEANIHWAESLQRENVHVIQSIPGYKVHAKLLLIRRKEGNKNIYYAGVGTGNFNETTAKVYTDKMLLTANQEIAREVNSVFHLFETSYTTPKFKHLVVAPFQMRNQFIRMINTEIRNAADGKEAWMILKMNSLVDEKIVKKLYEAGKAGVKIQLIIRGICVLIPGQESKTDNIEAISIVGRYLEHSRVLIFANGGDPKYYITSADWMVRNFDHRIEVACPVIDKNLQNELLTIMQIQLHDNTKARNFTLENPNQYRKGIEGMRYNSQEEIYKYLKDKIGY
jgi:polyphosphate kinase